MKKNIFICILFMAIFSLFPISVQAQYSSNYVVKKVSSTSASVIGNSSSLAGAKSIANQFNSTQDDVATIYDDSGKIVWAKYAIVKFKTGNTVKLYPYVGNVGSYTSVDSNSAIDAAFIDFDDSTAGSSTGMFKLKISGYTGWAVGKYIDIVPISQLSGQKINIIGTGVRIRTNPSTSASVLATISGQSFTYTDIVNANGYNWYKISYNGTTGWISYDSSWATLSSNLDTNYNVNNNTLYHNYTYYSNGYGVGYTNLGTKPSFLNQGTIYYSFDGNYFYTSIVSMLDDYRNNSINNSVNKNNPYYSYFQYLSTRTKSNVSANDYNNIVTAYGHNSSTSVMYNQGSAFVESQNTYSLNSLLTFSLACNESALGTSNIAKTKNNIFGYAAYDSSTSSAKAFSSVQESIMYYAQTSQNSYTLPNGAYYYGSHFGNKASGKNVKYATDPYWGEKAASHAYTKLSKISKLYIDYNKNTIGLAKNSVANVNVYQNTSTNSNIIYTLKHNAVSDSALSTVYNMPITITDAVEDSSGNLWYKIISDYGLDDNHNVTNNYSYDKSYAYVQANQFYVDNNQPTIIAEDKTIEKGSEFNYMQGVSATDKEDGDLTSKITYEGVVDTTQTGTYTVKYNVSDNSNFNTSKTVNITVKGESKPSITAEDKQISQYKQFNYLDDISAKDDNDGNLTSKITYEGVVDTTQTGIYNVTYSVTNSKNITTTKKIAITVISNEKPIITANDREVSLNADINYMQDVSAKDKEDGDLTSKITYEGVVDTTKIGTYTVTYKVTDLDQQTTTKKVTFKLVLKQLQEKDGLLYLDYLKNVDGKLQIKGYHTISGIDNNLSANIKYSIVFENVDTGEQYTQTASQITDKSEMTRNVYSVDGKNYTYSWFKLNINFNDLKQGNYRMYVMSESSDYYSKSIITNKLYKQQDSSYNEDKNVIIRSNYSDKRSPIELIVRTNPLALKNASYTYNQFDKYVEFKFNSDDTLHLKGLSYSYGSNLSQDKNITRNIIFENIDTYKTYTKSLGSIINGDYKAVLPEADNLDKTRAWYNADINLSDIPKGNYIIYITTTSNIVDISEFTEKLNRSLDSVTKTIDGKTYSFHVNFDKGNRIEMKVD